MFWKGISPKPICELLALSIAKFEQIRNQSLLSSHQRQRNKRHWTTLSLPHNYSDDFKPIWKPYNLFLKSYNLKEEI